MRLRNIALAAVLALAFSNAQAELFDRGGGLIYDDVLNVTWLQDAKYAVTSGAPFSTTDSPVAGYMTWQHSVDWASSLGYYDLVRAKTWTNWRLPKLFNPELGYQDCISGPGAYCSFGSNDIDPNTGELANLYYSTLGNAKGPGGLTNTGPFINMGPKFGPADFWYGDLFGASAAWDFAINIGSQGATSLAGGAHIAWAVMDGDVAPIPEPSTYAMLLAGLGLLGLTAKRRRQKLDA